MLSLGGEEAIATIGADGKVTFENPDHLTRLNSEDLLSLRLYLNGDAGNILWEYQMAGFSSFWSIYPNQQPEQIRNAVSVERAVAEIIGYPETTPLDWLMPKAYAEPASPRLSLEDGQEYYILGGMRVKLLFQAEKNTTLGKPENIQWSTKSVKVGPSANIDKGEFFADNDPASDKLANPYPTSSMVVPNRYMYEVYFQPKSWTTDLNVEITAAVSYKNNPLPKKYTFTLKSRELYPVSASKPNIYNTEKPQSPLQGTDVAMLEGLLWQLGLSPQYQLKSDGGKSGALGARIDSSRSGSGPSNTKNCQNTAADDRSKFYSGWKGQCAVGLVSLEGMVRRFQGRTFKTTNSTGDTISNLAGHITTSKVHGEVDNATLNALKKVYDHYRTAVYENPSTPRYISSNIPDSWWNDLAKMLNKGETIPYIGAGKSYTLNPTYTEAIHTAITADFPDNAKTITRIGLLKAWNYQENGGEFWGTGNYQRTPFRIYEGYSDEEGSFGFNHIVWKRMYGASPDCKSLRGYIADKHNVNLFHPKNSLMAFVAASADGCGSSRGLYWSYVKPDEDDGYASDIPKLERPKAYCYLDKDKATYCDRTVANKEHWKDYSATKVSGQELLGKAIIAYNRGANGFGERHYFSTTQMLKSDPNKKQPNRTFDYWMKIKEKTQTRAGITGYIPYVTYLWEGGKEKKQVPATPPAIGMVEVEVLWCFLYGEKDWINPIEVVDEDDLSKKKLAAFGDYLKRAIAIKSYRSSCSEI